MYVVKYLITLENIFSLLDDGKFDVDEIPFITKSVIKILRHQITEIFQKQHLLYTDTKKNLYNNV